MEYSRNSTGKQSRITERGKKKGQAVCKSPIVMSNGGLIESQRFRQFLQK